MASNRIYLDEGLEFTIYFTSKVEKKINQRTIIFPMGWSLLTVTDYFKKSLKHIGEILSCQQVGRVEILTDYITQKKNKNSERIDDYWEDVSQYIIEFEDDNRNTSTVMIVDCNIEEQQVKAIVEGKLAQKAISVEYYNDCWLKKI
ncbi:MULTISPECIES: hypothetical protein [unclassified Enterococcus]|uniref:hypothetical protein n=1 Tax=unclassified Enterococcus TaxID=2608891 RepID=UPI001557228E|nr:MULTISPECIES: hypothetical protein [unclassified Enterococcus]MBS7577583.1 hypothetical protein [Enterococcus sp. MMGLQ5-2]MBS7584918.1 hypothetical protein [Enterococcus sp. MMGLQ5-1]NPD12773.1 hypothetical protein [Enterococcus sp. MMGLQ5-1]NPD37416.1 hypothetical protein [Enterococcus sp. MMGLQ5-2]